MAIAFSKCKRICARFRGRGMHCPTQVFPKVGWFCSRELLERPEQEREDYLRSYPLSMSQRRIEGEMRADQKESLAWIPRIVFPSGLGKVAGRSGRSLSSCRCSDQSRKGRSCQIRLPCPMKSRLKSPDLRCIAPKHRPLTCNIFPPHKTLKYGDHREEPRNHRCC